MLRGEEIPSLPSLPTATWVDETLLADHERILAIRFGRSADPICQVYDAQLLEAIGQLKTVWYATVTSGERLQCGRHCG